MGFGAASTTEEVLAGVELGGTTALVTGASTGLGLETARALAPNEPLPYRFALPTANHVFLPGHRILVQVQSSWFPLYDRNPQTFVPNIFFAVPGDYRKAAQRVHHPPRQASYAELPRVGGP